MPIVFEALNEFKSAIEEVNALLNLACEHERLSYNAILKSAILLLSAKVEAFLEDILKEYIEKINALKLGRKIPSELTLQHLVHKIKQAKQITEQLDSITKKQGTREDKYDSMVTLFISLSELLRGNVIDIDNLKIPISFDYGKHGANAIERLFVLIGIDNVFDILNVMSVEISNINIKEQINTLIDLRNPIIHRDEDTGLTVKDVDGYVQVMKLFADKSTELLTICLICINYNKRKVI
ncbi:hypothetical protein MBAV_001008 [Candidatus Magnetobacterium bavaricum]|uniref:RiboL-PSP-HEPN domain-containing protein n=1 Tax=Candidatus Magnetobacterium bavaricum TaxID=29290 RepID=A0A0F3GXX6_9BACT|nr:hypothetical protein MBAV_001008 [Candidatus Magnetobacterium bavaricum]